MPTAAPHPQKTSSPNAGMIAFTFPGQGSQAPGMGAAWRDHPSWELVDEASEAAGRDVGHLLVDADADELRATRNSQFATMVASLVVLDAVERLGVQPAVYAGHSVGEYTALVASGAVSFEDGVRLVVERGEAMQLAAEEHHGTMAAVIGLDDDKVEVACARAGDDVWVANYNGPGDVVIAGSTNAIARAETAAKELGATRLLPLAVGGAFHTPFMAPAQDRVRKAVATTELRDPDLPVVANVDAAPHVAGADWAELLGQQLCSPVRWRQSLYVLDELGATTFVELGPGRSLTGMTNRTLPGSRAVAVAGPEQLDLLLELLHGHVPQPAGAHEGEHLFATERVVVSPAAGVFTPDPSLTPGLALELGQVVGHVGEHAVVSSFRGSVVGVLAVAGERVIATQPIAWLRTGER
jgi:[acyl-carrier-protein] S-malonyltransferase